MQVKLSHILSSLESGGRPKGGASLDNKGIPSLGAEHLDDNGGFNFKSVKYIPEDYFEGLKNGIIEKENILIVKDGATTGKVSFVNEDFPFRKAAVNEHVFLLKIDKSKAFPRFVFHYLKCPQGQRDILRDFRGATVGGISRGFVEFVNFKLPPLPDQRKIADILSKTESMIAQRKESIALLDDFLKSTFTDLFDNPVTNRKNYQIVTFKKFIKFLTSGGRGWKKYYTETGDRFIRSLDVQMNYISNTDAVFVNPPNIQEAKRTKVLPLDILLTITGSKIGRVTIVPENFGIGYVSQHVSIIRTEGINPLYLSYYLSDENCGQYLIKKSYYGQTKPGLNFKQIESFEVLVPPVELQSQFAQIVEKTETLKAQYRQSLQELENLYGSLSQRAFKGELTLDKNEENALMTVDPKLHYHYQYQNQSQLSIPSNKKGFAKLVLAGKIIDECKNSPEFTNIKFQKLQHLAEHLMEADLNLNYYNQAAGPYDNKFMHTLHDKMKQQKWFASRGYKYSPMEKVNEIDGHFNKYFGAKNDQFSKLIKLLGRATEDQCEIVSTLYAAWNDRIMKKEPITKEAIIQDFFNWSERKHKYSPEQLVKAIEWMKENGFEPKGFGELIKHSKKQKKKGENKNS